MQQPYKEEVMTSKVNKAELIKHSKTLNKSKLTDKIDTKQDLEDLQEDFVSAIEDIDDNNKIDDVKNSIIFIPFDLNTVYQISVCLSSTILSFIWS